MDMLCFPARRADFLYHWGLAAGAARRMSFIMRAKTF